MTALPLAACDPTDDATLELESELELDESELDEPEFELEGVIAFDPSERDELELLAPDEQDQTVSCDLGLPTKVYAGASKSAIAHGTIYGIASALYFFDAVRPNFPWLSTWSIKVGTTKVAELNQPSTFFFGSDGTPIHVTMQAPPGAVAGVPYDLQVRLYTASSQLACTDQVTLEIADCGLVSYWYTSGAPTPGYDGANCYVKPLPGGSQGFVWSNNWYVTPTNGNQCSIGSFDGANCYIGSPPGGHTAFIWSNILYYTL
ncbi:hypothetical protein ACNOYE_02305 [Nannocystaceae bacterium ST9]